MDDKPAIREPRSKWIDVTVCYGCLGEPIPPGKYCRVCKRSTPRPDGHHCHATGCTKAVKPELLMCLAHWRMVPQIIQRAVWANYRPGQCDDKDPSEAWHVAADAAIGAVASRECRPLTKAQVAAVSKFQR
jgi:hypothetical protein